MATNDNPKATPKPEAKPRCASATGYLALTPKQLNIRASFAGELWREGKIERTECFRIEMDAALGTDSGPVTFESNSEYKELLEVGWKPKRPDNHHCNR